MNRDFGFYMANLWVELERMFKFYELNDKKNLYGSLQRFIDLIAYIQKNISIPRYRKKEILRLKEITLDYFFWDKKYDLDLDFVKKYFTPFYLSFSERNR